uniref:Uncharacterized protein n=1 Tax=Arundo donax TaxID=35708 RepID=A0A0A9ED80_ARUDO
MKDTGGYLPRILHGMVSRRTQSLKFGTVTLLLVLGLSTSKTLFTNQTKVWELETVEGSSFSRDHCIALVRIAVVPMDRRLGCSKLKS